MSSNPTLEIYYCIVVTLAPPSSPTTTLSPVHSYGDPSSLMLDPSQAETTNEESLGIVASHQLLYIASHQQLHMVHRTHSGLHPTNYCTLHPISHCTTWCIVHIVGCIPPTACSNIFGPRRISECRVGASSHDGDQGYPNTAAWRLR